MDRPSLGDVSSVPGDPGAEGAGWRAVRAVRAAPRLRLGLCLGEDGGEVGVVLREQQQCRGPERRWHGVALGRPQHRQEHIRVVL